MKKFLLGLVRDEAGQDLIEYGLLIGIITALSVVAIKAIGPTVEGYFTKLNSNLAAGGAGE